VWLAGGAAAAVLVVVAAYYVDVATESDAFCGVLCHANRPEYVAHKVSEHENVECATCHIGPGLAPKVRAKLNGVGEMITQLTNTYERPIALPVEGMAPASVICAQCHAPQRLDDDRVRRISYFTDDEQTVETQTYLVLRAGGRDSDPQEPGIHWHVDNPVWYVARDALRQDIPWLGGMEDGELVGYRAADRPLTAEELAKMPRREMDCLDCHNRTGHEFRQPEQSVDEAPAGGRLDRSLPYVKREAVKLLTASYASRAEALKAIAGLKQFYRSEYPEVFAAKQLSIEQAVAELQLIYSYSVFPDMNVTSEAYADNLGHADSPGCFRCHDGQHLNDQGDSIPVSCDTCHSLPTVVEGDQEPDWVSILDLAAQAEEIPQIPHPLDEEATACLHCHGKSGLKPVPDTHQAFERLLNEPCLLCHRTEPVSGAPGIPHVLEGWDNCLACHSDGGVKPMPADHAGRASESCLVCHGVK